MMNRGLGSIMGYRGGGMPIARFQEGGLTQADRDRIILEYTQAVYAQPGITPQAAAAQIAQAMDQFDVSPEEYAGAFQRDTSIVTPEQRDIFGNVGTIQQSYEAVRPTGQYSARAEADRIARENQQSLAEDYSTRFFNALRAGDRQTALSIMSRAEADFPESDLFNIAAANIPGAGLGQDLFKTISGEDDVVTAEELRNYLTLTGTGTDTDTVIDTSTKGREDLTGGTTFTDAGNVRTDTTIPGVPGFTRQQASGFSFAPVQRGLGQLRGPAYMPGLLQGTEGFGGTGLSQKQVLAGIQPYAQRIERGAEPGLAIQDYILNEMIPQGLSPAEVAAASPTLSLGATQQYYNQFAPQGVFSTAAPGRTVLPEDFVLQTGAYTTPVIPRNIAIPVKDVDLLTEQSDADANQSDANVDGGPGGDNSGSGNLGGDPNAPGISASDLGNTIAQGIDVLGLTSVFAPTLVSEEDAAPISFASVSPGTSLGSGYVSIDDSNAAADAAGEGATGDGTGADSDGGPGGGGDPSADFAEGGDIEPATSNISTYIDRLIASGGTGEDIKGAMDVYGVTPEQVGEAYPQFSLEELIGNYENLQASPAERIRAFEKRYSTEEAVRQAGSKFDVADYLDEQGRLVSGYSKPMYDKFNRFIGYEYKPYESNVVFGRELREKEAAMRPTDKEREQMMVEMAMRQGRTGIDPRMGGLAGIEIGDPMMRRRPQYYSTVEESRPRYAEGGLANVAQNLADKGRKGDSMLVHMTPDEVAGLQALAQQMGGSLTINPQTGLPEANFFKKLLPMALGFALGPAGAGIFSSALTAGLAVGAGYTLATGSLQQGISAGLGAYGGSNLGTGLQAAGSTAAPTVATTNAATQLGPAAGGEAAQAAMVNPMQVTGPTASGGLSPYADISKMPFTSTPSTVAIPQGASYTGTVNLGSALTPTTPVDAMISATPTAPVQPSAFDRTLTGAERMFGDKATRDLAAQRYADATGSTLGASALQVAGGAAGQSAAEQEAAIKAQQDEEDRKRREMIERYRQLAASTLGQVNVRSGGLMRLAGGGMTYMEAGGTTGPTGVPRDVTGTGDGMSDSVPASIEGVQEARLADGEFVIPADVVADIGNGSSDAGSKKLYDMMDRVRMARHGTKEQPPEIKAERLMAA